MKIVFLADDFPPTSFGGAGISTYELARGMMREGHEVYAITTCRKKEDAGVVEFEGIIVHKIASDYPERWRAYVSLNNIPVTRQVREILKTLRPDVVHVNNVHFYLSYRCIVLARMYAKAVVFTARDTVSVCFGKLGTQGYLKNFEYRTTWRDHLRFAKKRYNPLYTFFTRRYLAYAHKRFAVSASLKYGLEANGIQDVEVMHTGGDAEGWNATEVEKKAFCEKYGLIGKKVVLFGGRLSEGKGGGKTLEAFLQVCREVPNAVLLVAGSHDAYAERMLGEAEVMGFRDRVIVTGWIQKEVMRVAYAVADVVVAPSLYLDPFPRIVIEAMASGKPVVSTCYGGAPEIVVDGSTGYVVNPFDTKEYADRIVALLSNEVLRTTFGKAGYARIKTDFNLGDVVKKYIGVYGSLLNKV